MYVSMYLPNYLGIIGPYVQNITLLLKKAKFMGAS